jgi:hypothetical protein
MACPGMIFWPPCGTLIRLALMPTPYSVVCLWPMRVPQRRRAAHRGDSEPADRTMLRTWARGICLKQIRRRHHSQLCRKCRRSASIFRTRRAPELPACRHRPRLGAAQHSGCYNRHIRPSSSIHGYIDCCKRACPTHRRGDDRWLQPALSTDPSYGQQAKLLFEAADWKGVHDAVRERIRSYDDRVSETAELLCANFGAASLDDATWQQLKLFYIGQLINHKQPELAETFFNSVCSKILHRTYFNNDYIFARPAVSTEYIQSYPPTYRSYYPAQSRPAQHGQTDHRRLRLATPLRGSRPGRRLHHAHRSEASRRLAKRRGQRADPGPALGFLPQQGGLSSSARRSTAMTNFPLPLPSCTRRKASWWSTRSSSTAG